MTTHAAIVTTAARAPLELRQIPTVSPQADEVVTHVEWTGSTPYDLHVADGGLTPKHPTVLGSCFAGTVVQLGPSVKHLSIDDKVFGFGFGVDQRRAHQELATLPEYLVGKIPPGLKPEEAVTVPANLVTVFNTMIRNFDIALPWPKPADFVPPHADEPIFIWGASSSVGQYAVQVLKYYGYRHILAAASKKHHALLEQYGATAVFDYRNGDITKDIVETAKRLKPSSPSVPLVIDCIGSIEGTMKPINKFVESGAQVAVMLPVIVRNSTEQMAPEYSMDVPNAIQWREGVVATGVRTHEYLSSEFLKENAQRVIMPELLRQGIVRPNKQRIIEGATMLERATTAMNTLRGADYSGEKLVWRVSDRKVWS